MDLMETNMLDIFGKRYLKPMINAQAFNGLKLPVEDNLDGLRDICTRILCGNINGINYLLIENLVQSITNQNHQILTSMLFDIFNKTTIDFANMIKESLNDNTFTLQLFLKKYQEYYNNTNLLKKCLWYYDKNMISTNDIRARYSYIILMKNMAIYSNIIISKYKYKDDDLYLYDIFNRFLTEQTPLNDILSLFKIYQFYNRLTTIRNNGKYFTNEIINKYKFLENNSSNNKLIQILNSHINEMIKDIFREKDVKNMNQLLNNIRSILQMGMTINNKLDFLLIYQYFLTDRLLKYQSEPKIELELLKMFINYKEEPEIYAKIKFQIYDTISSRMYTEIFHELNINIKTERFKDYDINKLKRDNCSFLVIRRNTWPLNDNDNDKYNVPDDIGIYLSIFSAYFTDRYKDKKIDYLHNISTGILKLKLRSYEEYYIHMTLPQIYIILTIAKAGSIMAKDISNYLGISLSKLSPIFNSLLDVELIIRSAGKSNDPCLLFSINWDKEFPNKKLSLVPLIKKI